MENEEVKIGEGNRKLLEIYDSIISTDDITYKTAAFLTVDNYYTYGLRISNEINGRQGKNRATIDYRTSQLMRYSLEDDVDIILDAKMNQLVIDIINTYLSDKQELPVNKPKTAQGMLSRVKALLIMLISNNNYGIIPSINIPRYVLKSTSELFESIQEIKNEILNLWIQWLIEHGNEEMAEITRRKGNDFWGSEGLKANVVWENNYGQIRDKIKNEKEAYNAFKNFRLQYRKTTKNMLPSRIYDIFNITPDAYNRAKLNVITELGQLFPEDQFKNALNSIIFEN